MGLKKTQFRLRLGYQEFKKGDEVFFLDTGATRRRGRVMSNPAAHYKAWYWKILYYMTFKQLFIYTEYYVIEPVYDT
jgi:hypothetical protein